ncbi:MAG: hypothetical protein IPK15_23940 [Verrucomicrobia bacterium]|nr:hypothetical protein [Verrucomicrobiota bacterium]
MKLLAKVSCVALYVILLVLPRVDAQVLEKLGGFSSASQPFGLARGTNGMLYGVTSLGGDANGGTFFRVENNGSITTLASFGPTTGTIPEGLTLGRDGNFYGTARGSAGTNSGGAIFKATHAGVLTHIAGFGLGLGFGPRPNMVEGEDGVFYGTTGGLNFVLGLGDAGSVFKVNVSSGVVTPLKLFSLITSALLDEGIKPSDGLARGTNGSFYGMCELGGVYRKGTIFQITSNGVFTKLRDLVGADGEQPIGTFLAASDGMLYGTAARGGLNHNGTAFRITTAGGFTKLTNFPGGTISSPKGRMVEAPDGSLIGVGQIGNNAVPVFRLTKTGGLSLLATIPVPVIHIVGAAEPSLVIGADGAAYGVLSSGGPAGAGYIYRVPLTGGWTAAAPFIIESGYVPGGGLTLAADGEFYGVTRRGGVAGRGTVYRMTVTGAVSRVADFTVADGKDPFGRLVATPGGVFYGVTSRGGTNDAGTVFRASTNGTLNTLASFGGAHGQFPNSLIFGSDGALYGTTSFGPGTDDGGRVFKITTSGSLTTFANLAPLAIGQPNSLLQASDGSFYGSATAGIFRVAANGVASLVAPLQAAPSPLVQGPDGHFYFTSYSNGRGGEGTVMRVTRDGMLSTMVDFADKPGRNPRYGLTLGPDGLLYGILMDNDNDNGFSVFFRVTTGGYCSVLYDLETGPTGLGIDDLESALAFGPEGNFYGVTLDGHYRLSQLPALPAFVQTGPADSIAETSAVLNGEVFTAGSSVSVSFEYGTTTNYGQTVVATPSQATGLNPVAVRANLSGLHPRTVYHFRLKAGASNGQDNSFRTGPLPTLADALNTTGLDWTTGPVSPWFIQTAVTFDGDAALQSGSIGDDEVSELTTTVMGPGRLTFRWKVSSEEDYDYLHFLVDDVLVAAIDGERDWQQISHPLTNGSHTITWRYTKDESSADGADAGWVDTVTWESTGQIKITQFSRLAGPGLRCRLVWNAEPGQRYAIDSSGGLNSWSEHPGTQRTATTVQESIDLDLGSAPPQATFFRIRRVP